MKEAKRIIALALILAMLAPHLSVGAYAAEAETEPAATVETTAPVETTTETMESETAEETAAETEAAEEPEAETTSGEETETEATEETAAETEPTEETAAETEPTEETAAETEAPEETAAETEPEEEIVEETISDEAVMETSDAEISQEDFEAALAEAGSSIYHLTQSLTLVSDLTIASGQQISIFDSGAITVPEGKTLTLETGFVVMYGSITVEAGGKLVVDTGSFDLDTNGSLTVKAGGTLVTNNFIDIWGGTLTIEEGGTFQTQGNYTIYIQDYISNGSVVSGVSPSLIRGYAYPSSGEELENAINVGKEFYALDIYLQEDLTLSGDLEIPANADVSVYDAVITVSGGASLTNKGSIIAREESEILLQEGSSIKNQGELKVVAPAVLTGEERVTGNAVVYEGYTTQEKFEKGYAVALGTYCMDKNLTLSSDLTIDGVEIELSYQGYITVPSGVTLTLAAPMAIQGCIAVESGGKLVVRDGTELSISYDGSLTVAEGGTITAAAGSIHRNYSNSWDGNVSGVPKELISLHTNVYYSFSQLQEMLSSSEGYASYEIGVYKTALENDITIPENVTLIANSLTIPGDCTLTNNGSMIVPNSVNLVIEEGGTLSNQGTLCVKSGGALNGTVTGNEPIYEETTSDDGETVMSQKDFEYAVLCEGYTLTKSVTYTTDSVFNSSLTIASGGSVTIASGVNLQMTGYISIEEGGSLTIENGGTIVMPDASIVYGGSINMNGGTLTVAEGGVLSMEAPRIMYFSGELEGVSGDMVKAYATASDYAQLEAAVSMAEKYGTLSITVNDSVTMERDLVIPENVTLRASDTLTIPKDTTLTNNGCAEIHETVIQNGAKVINNGTIVVWSVLNINEGGILQNPGAIKVYDGSEISGAEYIEGNAPSVGNVYASEKVATFEELKAAVELSYDENNGAEVVDTITLKEDLLIPSYMYLSIEDGGEIIVPNGVTLTIESSWMPITGKLTVEPGGRLVNNGYVCISYEEGTNGTISVASGGQYAASSDSTLYGSTDRITGIEKSEITTDLDGSSEAALREALADTGYKSATVYLDSISLTSDLTIPAGFSVYDGSIRVPDGMTLTVEGFLHDVQLKIERGGSLVIHNGGRATVYSDDELIFADGAEISIEAGGIRLYYEGQPLSSVPANVVDAECRVYSAEDLKALIAASAHYHSVEITLGSSIALAEDLTIPDNVTIIVGYWNGSETLGVMEGATLTNNGAIELFEGGVLLVQEGATLVNNGEINADDDSTMIIKGELVEQTPAVASVPMFRLYNPNSGEHFYTGSEEERDGVVELGWQYEGVAWNAPVVGEPVYRVYNPNSGDHHYTIDQSEVDMLKAHGWQYEGVAWNTASSDNIAQYRLWNPNADLGSHHYTSSTEERDDLVKLGWILEGIGWYGMLH